MWPMWTNYSSICCILPKRFCKIQHKMLKTVNFIRSDTLKCFKKGEIKDSKQIDNNAIMHDNTFLSQRKSSVKKSTRYNNI